VVGEDDDLEGMILAVWAPAEGQVRLERSRKTAPPPRIYAFTDGSGLARWTA
jgi:hypothetical protein